MNTQFAKDVHLGLSATPKHLSSMYFYDDRGSELFAEIMELPEYYLTRAEMDIFMHQSAHMVELIAMPREGFDLIELGAGNGVKTAKMLEQLLEDDYRFDYKPIDISGHALDQLGDMLRAQMPSLSYQPLRGDYFVRMEELAASSRPKTILFLGSNMGNMVDHMAHKFLANIAAHLHPGDHLVLGLDLIKPMDVVLPAYDDAAGVTRAFNLNLLTRINRELGGDFVLQDFGHLPTYNPSEGIARSALVAQRDVEVTLTATGHTYTFMKGEQIAVEQSRKYDNTVLERLLDDLPWRIKDRLLDSDQLFADYILERV